MNSELQVSIQNCTKCKSNNIFSQYITCEKPKSFFLNESPKVFLLGHSPSVRTSKEADYVLKLNKKGQPLYNYINEYILKPLNISIDQIYATNLIKCKTTVLPEDIQNKDEFFNLTFKNCIELFENEIKEIKPVLIISLSERVLTLLSKKYLGEELKMQDSFAKLFNLKIVGQNIQYIPLVHIPKGDNSKVKKHYFPEQTERLELLKIKS